MSNSPKEEKNLPYSFIIGLEIHVELRTATKMFCRCANDPFGAQPNQHTCPVCLGLPGTLPVPNREAVRQTIKVGKALGSTIGEMSKWDRKHYFYPDLPKGYQISQYDLPLCDGGSLALLDPQGKEEAVIGFYRVHLEEDAGKLQHTGQAGTSKVDLNRAGVPLIEMVTKAELTSPEQARRFMQEIRLLMRRLDVSDADMEKGQMRCDVNVNIRFEYEGKTVKTPITEVKNVNSTRAVERSLIVEGQRQYDEWMAGGPIRHRQNKLTAGWDEDTNTVQINRAKEAANDYRYFPEPDIPPLFVYQTEDLHPDRIAVEELPNQTRVRLIGQGIPSSDVEVLLNEPARLARLEHLLAASRLAPKQVANWLINAPDCLDLEDVHFIELATLVAEGKIGFAAVKPRLTALKESLMEKGSTVENAARRLGLVQEHDEGVVQLAIAKVIQEHQEAVQQFLAGNEKIIGFLVGHVMKEAAGKAQPQRVQEAVRQALADHK